MPHSTKSSRRNNYGSNMNIDLTLSKVVRSCCVVEKKQYGNLDEQNTCNFSHARYPRPPVYAFCVKSIHLNALCSSAVFDDWTIEVDGFKNLRSALFHKILSKLPAKLIRVLGAENFV